ASAAAAPRAQETALPIVPIHSAARSERPTRTAATPLAQRTATGTRIRPSIMLCLSGPRRRGAAVVCRLVRFGRSAALLYDPDPIQNRLSRSRSQEEFLQRLIVEREGEPGERLQVLAHRRRQKDEED